MEVNEKNKYLIKAEGILRWNEEPPVEAELNKV